MKIAPVLSSSVAGPLGILHLPRLWLKIVLHATGRLPAGYRHGSGGFDERLFEYLGIDRDAFVAYVEGELPDYRDCERYVLANARDLSPQTIAAFNNRVRSGTPPDDVAAERRERFGITDESFANACALNDLDDWAALHAELVASPRHASEIEQLEV
jgi:hypothetical protein